jgi:hypothetical protein
MTNINEKRERRSFVVYQNDGERELDFIYFLHQAIKELATWE